MRIFRASDHRRMPWKNGGGETTEIAVAPEGAGLDDFDWRVSMARVERDGPFSAFPGIDRTLSILEGEGLRLMVDGQPAVELAIGSEPFAFPADQPTDSTLLGGAVTDLNVMTRRAHLTHNVRRLHLSETAEIVLAARIALLFCHRGSVRISGEGVQLGPLDCLLTEIPPETWRIEVDGVAVLFLIEIKAAG